MIAALCIFAFLAGFVDAMVGGGGLVQLPAFFIFQPHLTLVQTLASNKTASFLGTSVAAVEFLKKVRIQWRQIAIILAAAFLSSVSGAFLVSQVRKEQFLPVIIIALIGVLTYTVYKRELGLHHTERHLSKRQKLLNSLATGGLIGFYDGLIGPGTGSFLIFAFVVLFGFNFLHAAANAKLVNLVTNIAALGFFFIKGHIVWSVALPVGLANMAGNYLGSKLALRKGSGFVRIFFIIVVILLILKLGFDYWKQKQ